MEWVHWKDAGFSDLKSAKAYASLNNVRIEKGKLDKSFLQDILKYNSLSPQEKISLRKIPDHLKIKNLKKYYKVDIEVVLKNLSIPILKSLGSPYITEESLAIAKPFFETLKKERDGIVKENLSKVRKQNADKLNAKYKGYHTISNLSKTYGISKKYVKEYLGDSNIYSESDRLKLESILEKEKENLKGFSKLSDLASSFNYDQSTLYYVLENCEKRIVRNTTFYKEEQANLIFQNQQKIAKDWRTSNLEKEFLDWIEENSPHPLERNNRSILKGSNNRYLELDGYIPEKKIAFEFDGVYFHQNKSGLEKYILCEKQGIRLIRVFDVQWMDTHTREILKSIILASLGKGKIVYARNCEFREVEHPLARLFLEENHLQGYSQFSKAYGLFEKNQLVQLVTFQIKSNHNNSECELNRMVTLKGYRVLGGFSKLVKHSFEKLNVEKITSYIDHMIFNGESYYKVGFTKEKDLPPVEYYVWRNHLKRREFVMKKNIKKLYEKGVLKYYDESSTGKQLIAKNHILVVKDSGKEKVSILKSNI